MKIAFCMPVHGSLTKRFAFSAMNMIVACLTQGVNRNGSKEVPEIRPFMASSADIAFNRNILVREALDWGADYLLFADVDHYIPPDGLDRLVSLDRDVVGINYLRRDENDRKPTCARRTADGGLELVWTTQDKAEAGVVEQVDFMGLGFCLVAKRVFDKLAEQAKADGRDTMWPIFYFERVEGSLTSGGEDSAFFRQCAAAGVSLFIDHWLSFESGHLTEVPLMFPARPQFVASTRIPVKQGPKKN
jgi:hypothetical protein